MIPINKLLSHRLRGFGEPDNSIPALKQCLENKIKYLEIDIRVSKDGELIVYHDPFIQDRGKKLYLHEMDYTEISSRFSVETIPTLKYFIETYLSYEDRSSILCIDVKDFGYEKELHALLSHYNIIETVYLISWIPETLLKLAKLDLGPKLLFSYYPLDKQPLGNFFSNIISNLSMALPLTYFHITGKKYKLTEESKFLRGYQRVVMTTKIPEDLLSALQATGGGVCIEKKLIDTRLLTKLKELNLQVWVFGLSDRHEYFELETDPQIDVIFSDDVKYVLDNQS